MTALSSLGHGTPSPELQSSDIRCRDGQRWASQYSTGSIECDKTELELLRSAIAKLQQSVTYLYTPKHAEGLGAIIQAQAANANICRGENR